MIGIDRAWCAHVHDLKGPITFNKYQQILVTALDYNKEEIVLTAAIAHYVDFLWLIASQST